MRFTKCSIFIFLLFAISMGDNPVVQTVYTADPAPMVYDGKVYLYTSHDEDVLIDGFFTMMDWRCYSSEDMVNWTDHGAVASLKSFNWTGSNGAWAPQAIYRNGKFYLYCPIHMKGIGVLVSDSPFGPFSDPLKKPLINNSMADIDPTVFIDTDGQAYLYWGNPNLYYVKLNEDMISYSGRIEQIPLTVESFGRRSNTERPTSYEEGPWFYKRNSTYYMVFAGGPISEHIAYSTSPGPTGPWTYRGVIMPTQGGSFTNHPGIIDFKGNSYLFYHNAALPGGGGFKRSVCVEQFSYNADGTIPTINMTKNGAPQVGSLNPFDTIQAETICWQSGVETAACSEGGMMVTDVSANDYIKVKGANFGDGAEKFEVRAASGSSGGTIELRLGSQTGTLVGTCTITGTGSWTTWKTFECAISNCTGIKDLFLVFKGSGEPFRLNWYRFSGPSGYLLSSEITGQGTITRSPNSTSYAEGTSVTLTAQPETGWEFIEWSGIGVSGNQNPLTITMNADRTITALFARKTVDGNLVLNGDFTSGTTNWTLNVWGGEATGSVTGGEYQFAIASTGTNSYDIQLVQPGLFLQNGKTYQVTFDARAESDRTLEVNMEMADNPWTSYLPELQHFDLTTTKQTYSFIFTMEQPSDVNGRLGFNVSTSTADVFIDNVAVKLHDLTSVSQFKQKISSKMKTSYSNGLLKVVFSGAENNPVQIRLYSLKGDVVQSVFLQRQTSMIYSHSFNMSNNPSGFYIVEALNGNKTISSSRVLITR